MKLVHKKLRVVHFPNIPCKGYNVEVKDEYEAKKICEVLADQHLWLLKNRFIPDYSNIVIVEMFEKDVDGEGLCGWTEYYNEIEMMDWNEFLEAYDLQNL